MPRAHSPLTRRALLLAGGAVALAGCAALPVSGPPRLRLLGEAMLRHGLRFRGTTVGGLSALDFDPASGAWVALSDDPSRHGPARFYTLAIDVARGSLGVQVLGVTPLLRADGTPFSPAGHGGEAADPEALRLLPGGRGLLWASEGDPGDGRPPTLRQARRDGSAVRDFAVPALLQFSAAADTGARANRTLEGLALTPDGRTAWVAMEGALRQDGPLPAVGRPGAACRFTAFDLATGRPVRQRAYSPDAVPLRPLLPAGRAENGVSEILMVDGQRMLVLERAYSAGRGVSLRLYEADTASGSDTLGVAQLRPGAFAPMAKRLVADVSHLGLSRLDNTEGMCWGPPLPDGTRTLVVVSDDNFSALQVTQFAAFEYLDPT